MSPFPMIKICGITTEADALLAVGLGADAIGFVMAPSPRQVSPTAVGDIVKRLPHGVYTVGVFRDEAPARVVEVANRIGLTAVQLHGHETAADCRWVADRVQACIKGFAAGDPAIERFRDFGADLMLIDGPSPGSGKVFDWRVAEGVVDSTRLIVSGGLRPDNVAEAIFRLRPHGVDVSSGVESSPGRKDPHLVRTFVAAARQAAEEVLEGRAFGRGANGERDVGSGGAGDGDDEGPSGSAPYDWMDG